MLDIVDLIGVRFLSHGRSKSKGFDCYGLVIEIARRMGHELKDLWYEHGNSLTFSQNAEGVLSQMNNQIELTEEQKEGNLVIFLENGKMVHIGVIVDKDKFIHCDKYGVRIMRLSEYFRRSWRIYKWSQ